MDQCYHSCSRKVDQDFSLESILVCRTPAHTWPLQLGTILSSEITSKKHKDAKKGAKRISESELLWIWELEQEHCRAPPQLGTCTLGNLNVSSLSACPLRTTEALQILIWGLQINFSKWICKYRICKLQINCTSCSLSCGLVEWPISVFWFSAICCLREYIKLENTPA